jgi:lipid-binding SYLF domain-containing protein
MRSTTLGILCLAATVVASTAYVRADEDRLKNATDLLADMAGAGDKGIPLDLLHKAKCAFLVPGVKKFALGVGGKYGKGYASCRRTGGSGWTAPAAIEIEGGSIGFQIGGSSTDYVLLIMNDRGMDHLLSSKFTIGGDASAAAGPVGREAQADTDVTLNAEILSWSRSRGLFAGISLQGSTLHEDSDSNKDLYGEKLGNREILSGKVPVPAAAEALVHQLSLY